MKAETIKIQSWDYEIEFQSKLFIFERGILYTTMNSNDTLHYAGHFWYTDINIAIISNRNRHDSIVLKSESHCIWLDTKETIDLIRALKNEMDEIKPPMNYNLRVTDKLKSILIKIKNYRDSNLKTKYLRLTY